MAFQPNNPPCPWCGRSPCVGYYCPGYSDPDCPAPFDLEPGAGLGGLWDDGEDG